MALEIFAELKKALSTIDCSFILCFQGLTIFKSQQSEAATIRTREGVTLWGLGPCLLLHQQVAGCFKGKAGWLWLQLLIMAERVTARKRKADFFWDFLVDDEDEEDEEDEFIVILAAAAASSSSHSPTKRRRPNFFVRERIEWDAHVAALVEEGPHAFPRMYRMSYESFVKLCSYIDSFCQVDAVMSTRRSSKAPIVTEIALHCLL